MVSLKRFDYYEQSINKMWEQVLEMGNKVESLLEEALQALLHKDPSRLGVIIEYEGRIDEMNERIEMQALELISLQQPLEEDLRKLAAFMRIVKDLERVGDLGVNIGEAVVKLSRMGDYFKPLIDIPRMARLSQDMICKSLAAYKEQDTTLAEETCKMDEIIDDMYLYLQEELVEYMKKDASTIDQACQFLLISRDLERIGDHAENIAEMVNFMVTGQKRICD
ncbi:MAG: phosphate signaling complex protein PhoU [Bacillota bacterium]